MRRNFLSRYVAFAVCVFCFLSVSKFIQPSRANAADPNIIIIQADNLGWGDVCASAIQSKASVTNSDLCSPVTSSIHPGTQNIDSLAQGGVTMTNFHAATPSCSPSRASLLTGMHARRHGVLNNNGGTLDFPRIDTLASLLREEKQYNTVFIGKWHIGGTETTLPQARGFGSYYASPSGVERYGLCFRETNPAGNIKDQDKFYITHNYMAEGIPSLCTGTGDPAPANWWDFVTTTVTETNLLRTKSMSEVLTDKTIEYIDSLKTLNTRPVFLYLNYSANHGPLDIDIADVPFYFNDGIVNGTDIISYQQYKARIRTITGSSTHSQFTVGNYIYTAPTDTFSWAGATALGARGKIISIGGTYTSPVITYYLLGPNDFAKKDAIKEYSIINGSDIGYGSFITTEVSRNLYDSWFDPASTGYRKLTCKSSVGTFNPENYIYTGTWGKAKGLGKIINVTDSEITYQLINSVPATRDFAAGNAIIERTSSGNGDATCTIADTPTDAHQADAASYYNQAIKEIDNGVGRILSEIAALPGGVDNTIVIFLSDNGANMGGSLEYWTDSMFRKSTGGLRGGYPYLYEGGARIPFIAKWPGNWGDGNGLSSDQLSEVTDILPTLLKAAGVTKMPKTPIDGVDVSSVLQDPVHKRQKKTINYHNFDARRYYGPSSTLPDKEAFPFAIWSYDNSLPDESPLNNAKLFLDFDNTPKEFYNLYEDIQEINDIVSSSTDTVILANKSADFLDSFGHSTKFDFKFTRDSLHPVDQRLYLSARDPNEAARTNVRVQFYNSDNKMEGVSELLSLKTGEAYGYPITYFCDGGVLLSNPTCTGFTGSIKVFTDKPAYVTVASSSTSTSGSTLSVGQSRTLVFPTIVDKIGEIDTSILITNPTDFFLDVVVTAVPTTNIATTDQKNNNISIWVLNSENTRTTTLSILSKQTVTYQPQSYFPNGFEGRVRFDALAKDAGHDPKITGVAVYSGVAPIPQAYAGNLATATTDSFPVSAGTTTILYILANDYNKATDLPPRIKSVVTPSNFRGVLINRGNYVEYTAPSDATCDTFTYTIKTEEGDTPVGVGYPSSSATVTISVDNANCQTP